jgi:hypothetical protein
VRYEGWWARALFFAPRVGVQPLQILNDWVEQNAPEQAVLIFVGPAPENLSHEGYSVSTIALDTKVDSFYPVITREAGIARYAEVWWPGGISESVAPQRILDNSSAEFYYSGLGCYTPPIYANGTMHFYQYAWAKLTGAVK